MTLTIRTLGLKISCLDLIVVRCIFSNEVGSKFRSINRSILVDSLEKIEW